MPTITLKEGDFGTDLPVSVGEEELFLPDPDRPGLKMVVPLVDVAEMEALENEGSERFKEALKLGAKGFLRAGPAGLLMGNRAATKVHDVIFQLVFKDGRRLVAVSDARTYADLHAAQVAARGSAFAGDAPSPADAIIAKYLDEARSPEGDGASTGGAPEAEPVPVPEPPPMVERRATARPGLPTFGRRRSTG